MHKTIGYFLVVMLVLCSSVDAHRTIVARVKNHLSAYGVSINSHCSGRTTSTRLPKKSDAEPIEKSVILAVGDDELFKPTFEVLARATWNSPLIKADAILSEQLVGEWTALIVDVVSSGQDDELVIKIVPVVALAE